MLNVLLKLEEQLPTNQMLVRNGCAINPVNMAKSPQAASKRFIKLVDSLYALKFVTSVADNAKFQFDQMLKKEVIKNKDKFLAFNFRTQRVNEFLGYYVGNNPEYKELWEVCKLIFVLQHGQSFTERGFSINKNVSDVNMQEDSLIAQRFIYDVLK